MKALLLNKIAFIKKNPHVLLILCAFIILTATFGIPLKEMAGGCGSDDSSEDAADRDEIDRIFSREEGDEEERLEAVKGFIARSARSCSDAENYVAPGFEPIEITSHTTRESMTLLRLMGKEYRFGMAPFPTVTLEGERELFTHIPRYSLSIDGDTKRISWRYHSVMKACPGIVRLLSNGYIDRRGGVTAYTDIEYNGKITTEFRIYSRSRDINITNVQYDFPISKDGAIYNVTGVSYDPQSHRFVRGDGSRSEEIPVRLELDSFPGDGALFIGNRSGDNGIGLMSQTFNMWTRGDNPPIVIDNSAANEAILRFTPVGAPVTVGRGLSLRDTISFLPEIGDCTAEQLNVKDFGAIGDGESHPITQNTLSKHPDWSARYGEGVEIDTAGIQDAIDAAQTGQIVCFPGGTYLLYREGRGGNGQTPPNVGFKLKSNVNLSGPINQDRVATIKNGRAGEKLVIDNFTVDLAQYTTLRNIKIELLTFEEIQFDFSHNAPSDTSKEAFKITDIIFDTCTFNNAVTPWDQVRRSGYKPIIAFSRAKNVTVNRCVFNRDSDPIHTGAGVLFWSSHNCAVLNSTFTGHFITAVNVQGGLYTGDNPPHIHPIKDRSYNITICNNTAQRTMPHNTNYDDHGIYAYGMIGLKVINNNFSGWNTRYMGSIKVRNGSDMKIKCNFLRDSGVLGYTYGGDNVRELPWFLKEVEIEDNVIIHEDFGIREWDDDGDGNIDARFENPCDYRGIAYWRNIGSSSDSIYEHNISINNNKIINGCISVDNAYGHAFRIGNNMYRREHIGADISGLIPSNNIVYEDSEPPLEAILPDSCPTECETNFDEEPPISANCNLDAVCNGNETYETCPWDCM